MSDKRADYLSWDEYFMGVASLASKRSKDPNTQVGACIVDKENYIISVGYNGMPLGCSDDDFPWDRNGGVLDSKYAFETRYSRHCSPATNAPKLSFRRRSRGSYTWTTSITIPRLHRQPDACLMPPESSMRNMNLPAAI